MKKFSVILGILFIIGMFIPIYVFAETDSLNEIVMDIKIDENGTAFITETWDVEIYSGTEMYKEYFDMEDSKIENLSVSDETGMQYEFQESWNIKASRDEKIGKCGIDETSYGQEICWGIGEYGSHTYTISYEITNYIYSLNGKQQSYFRLIQTNMDPLPNSVKISISAPFEFTEENVTVSSSGFLGTTQIEDGIIKITTNSALKSSQSVDVKLELEEDLFNVKKSNINYNKNEENNYNLTPEQEKMHKEAQENMKNKRNKALLIFLVIILILVIIERRNRKNYYGGGYY